MRSVLRFSASERKRMQFEPSAAIDDTLIDALVPQRASPPQHGGSRYRAPYLAESVNASADEAATQ
jgi:hypothetical protein